MQATWNKIKTSIHQKVPHSTYMLWIDPLRLSEKSVDDLVITCPDSFSQKWIVGNYMGIIRQEAEKILGKGARIELKIKNSLKIEGPPPAVDPQLLLPNIPSPQQRAAQPFRSDFTFDRFVVGVCNDFAYTASLTLANERAPHHNTLFLLADTGLGKSHLSHAIGNHILQENPEVRICYLTAENFTNEMISSLKSGSVERFKKKYRNQCDILLLEDIQFLSGKEKIQDELAFTLDALLNANKKLIFTSSYPLDEIPKMNANLKSRLTSGIISDTSPPDSETRVRMISNKVEKESTFFAEDVIYFLAQELTGDIRQMESGIVGVLAKSSLLNLPIDLPLAETVVQNISKKQRRITVQEIQKLVCKCYKISLEDIASRSRKRSIARPRQIAMYLSRRYTNLSLQAIGNAFNRYHATTLHAIEAVESLLKKKGPDYRHIQFLSERLGKDIS
ncbi:MAG: chromosomal replication initiator protein DnaA [Deltaproteobacteria bacterium]|nr:chromosomal replication initiator protein DnaA [Deltaproteobacteria bacterium]